MERDERERENERCKQRGRQRYESREGGRGEGSSMEVKEELVRGPRRGGMRVYC